MTKLLIGAILFASITCCFSASNLTCYQCKRSTEEECGLEDLKPCLDKHDRCVTLFTKNNKDGLSVRRQCGLAPCEFQDEMASKGLGMNCDRSKPEYMCTICCKESGCNRNHATSKTTSKILLILALVFVCVINVARDFIPPYVMAENTNFKK